MAQIIGAGQVVEETAPSASITVTYESKRTVAVSGAPSIWQYETAAATASGSIAGG